MGLGTKTYWLTDRQSQCDFDFDFKLQLTLDAKPSIFIRDKPILSSERMLHKDYYRKRTVKSLVMGLMGLGAETN
jgi:hypothetical protein